MRRWPRSGRDVRVTGQPGGLSDPRLAVSSHYLASFRQPDPGRADLRRSLGALRQAAQDGGAFDHPARVGGDASGDLPGDQARKPQEAHRLMDEHLRIARAAQGDGASHRAQDGRERAEEQAGTVDTGGVVRLLSSESR